MQKRILPALFTAAVTVIIFISACTKIDSTNLGADVLAVDNINTFADTLKVVTSQYNLADSTILAKDDNYVIGKITGDPLFGNTEGLINVQFKPTFYPFYFGSSGSITSPGTASGLDSAFVCLSYKSAWGDTSATAIGQTFEIYRINDPVFIANPDTVWKLNATVITDPQLLGSATITPQIAQQKAVFGRGTFKDSVTNQIRIRLNTSAGITYMNGLFNSDSSAAGANNYFFSDAKFRTSPYGSGLQIRVKSSDPGHTLYYVNMSEIKSRFEFHFKKKATPAATTGDTLVQSLQMYPTAVSTTKSSACFNNIQRNYTGSQIAAPLSNQGYLQASPGPGAFVNIKIDSLSHYPNRIIHRAYLIVEQTLNDPTTDNWYTAPDYVYVDLKNPVINPYNQYKPVYFDLSDYGYNPDITVSNGLYHPYPISNVATSKFGGIALTRTDASGAPYTRYEVNLTRYVQHIVSNGYTNYELRLFAPYSYYYPQYAGLQYIIPYYNAIAKGRVRIGGGNHATHPMRLVIVYSKI